MFYLFCLRFFSLHLPLEAPVSVSIWIPQNSQVFPRHICTTTLYTCLIIVHWVSVIAELFSSSMSNSEQSLFWLAFIWWYDVSKIFLEERCQAFASYFCKEKKKIARRTRWLWMFVCSPPFFQGGDDESQRTSAQFHQPPQSTHTHTHTHSHTQCVIFGLKIVHFEVLDGNIQSSSQQEDQATIVFTQLRSYSITQPSLFPLWLKYERILYNVSWEQGRRCWTSHWMASAL